MVLWALARSFSTASGQSEVDKILSLQSLVVKQISLYIELLQAVRLYTDSAHFPS